MLEVGKSYTLNDGREFECTGMRGDDPNAVDEYGYGPFLLNGCWYHKDGTFASGGYDGSNVMFDKEIEPINTIQVGETYPTQSQGSYKCIAIEGDIAWLAYNEISAAYRWSASTGESLCLNSSYDIVLTPKPVRETVEYVGHWDGVDDRFYDGKAYQGKQYTIRITFEKVDGIPDWSTLKAENAE